MLLQKFIFFFVFIILFYPAKAQITITDADMPNVNDTVLLSVKQTLTGFNQNSTGPNYNWDYSFLVPDSQRVERFVSPSSTGYPFVNFFSTYALPNYKPDLLPFVLLGTPPTNVFDFYKSQSSSLTITIQGVTVSGTALPIIYKTPDVIYKFPLQYGNIDSSNSGYANAIPNTGYFSKKQKRVNKVDGWGTLTTPYGTFNTLRVKSVITVVDSLYLDTLGFGFNTPPVTTYEFKWLAAGSKAPVLEIDASGALTGTGLTVTGVLFQDSVWSDMDLTFSSYNTCLSLKQGSAQVFASGGRSPRSYSWSNGATTAYINNLELGQYTVTVTDRYGKTATSSTNIETKVDAACLKIPNGFTPDGDGVNDTWIIRGLSEFKNCKVEIFNQWGSLLFASNGYATPWDGRYNSQPVEAGTYYYVIDIGNGNDKFNGSVTIIK